MTRKLTPLALIVVLPILAACSHGSASVAVQNAPPEPRDIAGIGPRPHVFGRRAWDDAQAQAQARLDAQKSVPVAVAPPPPPAPAPVVQAPMPAPAVAPTPVAAPPAVIAAPVPAPVQMAAASPPAAPAPLPAMPAPLRMPAQRRIIPVPQAAPAPVAPTPAPAAAPPAKHSNGFMAFLRAHTADGSPPREDSAHGAEGSVASGPVVGGYELARDKKAVADAAAFALHESPLYELLSVYSAKTQVVAGTNYSLCLWVRQKGHEANPLHRRMVAATVFQGLDKHYELTNWYEVNVCHAGT